MTKMSNAEKQMRFRKKEELKEYASNIFRDWQFSSNSRLTYKDPKEVRTYLDNIINLPSGWSADDYNRAVATLQNFHTEFYFGNPNQLKNDIENARNSTDNFIESARPRQWVTDANKATYNMQKLATHIISTLDLTGGTASDNAAAIMEVMRYIGRTLLNEKIVPKSNATAFCLASIAPQFERPDWFAESLTRTLALNVGKELIKEIEKCMHEFKESGFHDGL